jgi:iron-sulfur cluster repair protein YtfE (RIC family)
MFKDLVETYLTLDASIAREKRLSLMADIETIEYAIDRFHNLHVNAYDTLVEQLNEADIKLGTMSAYTSSYFTVYASIRNELNKSIAQLQPTLNNLYSQLGIKV